jgi:hypothetical protein
MGKTKCKRTLSVFIAFTLIIGTGLFGGVWANEQPQIYVFEGEVNYVWAENGTYINTWGGDDGHRYRFEVSNYIGKTGITDFPRLRELDGALSVYLLDDDDDILTAKLYVEKYADGKEVDYMLLGLTGWFPPFDVNIKVTPDNPQPLIELGWVGSWEGLPMVAGWNVNRNGIERLSFTYALYVKGSAEPVETGWFLTNHIVLTPSMADEYLEKGIFTDIDHEDVFTAEIPGLRELILAARAGEVISTPKPEPVAPTPAPAPVTATPSQSRDIVVNGETITFDAYIIDGNNYIKLRDFAYVLNGTPKQFNIGWDAVNDAISLTSQTPYTTHNGTEMAQPSTTNRTAVPTTSRIFLDGEEVHFTAYFIHDSNYFRLRDVMQSFDVYVGWDAVAGVASLDTSRGYGEEETTAQATPAPTPEPLEIPEYITIKGEKYDTSLTDLRLVNMRLTDEDIIPLKYMVNLTILVLGDNQISDVSPLSDLKNLTNLVLHTNQISDISPLSNLTGLAVLNLANNKITDIKPLSNFSSSAILDLRHNQITDWSAVAHVTHVNGRP